MRAGPLDMRMSQSGPTASTAVNTLSEGDLSRIFMIFGEEKQAGRIARLIIRARDEGPITTKALGRTGKIHPATRVFQALRIFINDELGELYRGLLAAERVLNPGGRLIVVTFHSLEDRIVKKFLRIRSERPASGSRYMPVAQEAEFTPGFELNARSVIKPSEIEVRENPRSRSAKLRVGVRTAQVDLPPIESLLPKAPSIADYRWAA